MAKSDDVTIIQYALHQTHMYLITINKIFNNPFNYVLMQLDMKIITRQEMCL